MKHLKIIKKKTGFAMINFLIMFVLIFPLTLLIPDMVLWGVSWLKIHTIVNDTAQFVGEHGGGDSQTTVYVKNRLVESGLNPSEWNFYITEGTYHKGTVGVVALESKNGYTFNSVQAFEFDLTLPVRAKTTFTSQIFCRGSIQSNGKCN